MKLSEITAALRDLEISPAKSLGQNFLHDQNLARSIIDQANVSADDFILEIGPGLGALTEFILERGARVMAIEKDTRLANFVRKRLSDSRLEVLSMDALDFDVGTLFARPRVKFIGNLPYSISNPLLLKYLEYPSPICLWILTLQKEVAQRLSAAPNTKNYGAVTLLVQLHYLGNLVSSSSSYCPDFFSSCRTQNPCSLQRTGLLCVCFTCGVHSVLCLHTISHYS